jgi:hypothetical protein
MRWKRVLFVAAVWFVAQTLLGSAGPLAASPPADVLFTFTEGGDTVTDSADTQRPIDLRIPESANVRRDDGAIQLRGQSAILSKAKAARPLIDRVSRSGELTVEVWLTPDDLRQRGPARIVTLSNDPSHRNFTVGQEGDRFDVRLRSTKTSDNGLPSLASPSGMVTKQTTHLVFVRERNGTTRLAINGKTVARGSAPGTLENWSRDMRLALGDEVSGGRPWKGTLHRVAIYSAALDEAEVMQRYRRGADARKETPEQIALREARRHFERNVAPILAKHCLECHDAANSQGDLVLDRKATVLESSVVPGDAAASPLWQAVENDSMPHQRPPLTEDQKQTLRKWIDDGAEWTVAWIDPADYRFAESPAYVRRLTVDEYIRSVKAAVGVDVTEVARTWLPQDVRADGFSNTAYNLTVDLDHVEAYNRLAKEIVGQLDVKELSRRFDGNGRLTDKDMRKLISRMGEWILRGPLTDAEIIHFRGISTSIAAAGGDYEQAVAATVQAMLQSPRFLYRIENQSEQGTVAYLNDHELASRLSFILWGAPPDKTLADLASKGHLSRDDVLQQQVTRMLDDPRAVERSRDFIAQWLNLDHLRSLQPSAERFPNWRPELAEQMREETLAFFEHVVWKRQAPLTELLDAQVTFCGPELAKHYGLEPRGEGLRRYDLADRPERGGLLTHGSVLTLGGDDASMVTRGLFVMTELLRGVVNDPPPCVDTSPVPAEKGLSARMISMGRIRNEACGGCHKRFEPLAFGLEKFDGIGAHHQRDEHGNRLRDDGSILVPGTAEATPFETAAELMRMLADSRRVEETLVWKLTQFAVGRPLSAADAGHVREIHRRARESGATYQAVMREIIRSPLVIPR